jgi:hypothetical protein
MASLKNTTINDTGYFKLGEESTLYTTPFGDLIMYFYSTFNQNLVTLYFYDNTTYNWFYIVTE